MLNNFEIIKKDGKTRARLGVLTTPHGAVKTPSYVFVATYGHIRHLTPVDIKKTKTQILICNTYHLWDKVLNSKSETLNKSKIPDQGKFKTFLVKNLELNIPTMTDSGGFQVLSLAFGDKNKVSKFMTGTAKTDKAYKRSKIRITETGVYFKKWDDLRCRHIWKFLGPKLSMKIQNNIGADIVFAFDHITSPLDSYAYNKKAVELTNKWAIQCLKINSKFKNLNSTFVPSSGRGEYKQQLFGIIQGGLFKDLRIKSAKSIGAMPFDGFGIGGSYTKKQIAKTLKWTIPYLPEEKPRHLLGVGKVADIFEAVENGIDLFDCVIPTREARHGRLYAKTGHMDIRRGIYKNDKKTIEPGCKCPTCLPTGRLAKGALRSQIRELIKSSDPKQKAAGQRWCLLHNIWFFNNLLEQIRESIQRDNFSKFKIRYLKKFKS